MPFIMDRIRSMSILLDCIMFMQKGIISPIIFRGSFPKASAI